MSERFMSSTNLSINYATWKKYIVLGNSIERLRVRDKRHIFQMIRTYDQVTPDTFFPQYGFTAGEFSVWQVLSDNNRKKQKNNDESAPQGNVC